MRVKRVSMPRLGGWWLACGAGLVLLFIYLLVTDTSTIFEVSEDTYFVETLQEMLIPRFPDSEGHQVVYDFLFDALVGLGFETMRDEYLETFPVYNVVGVFNSKAKNFLLLSCHYDSKFLETIEEYVGATDAAVSCAILLNVAKKLSEFLHYNLATQANVGLILAFFDAHHSMGGITDNTYPLLGSEGFVKRQPVKIADIGLVVSLNQIGAPDQIYMSKYRRTYKFHERLANIEEELRTAGHLAKCDQLFYKLSDNDSDMDDDHFSFLEKGLPVMHIAPHTYPDVWLKADDNFDNIHWPSVVNINNVLIHFVYEYLSNATLRNL